MSEEIIKVFFHMTLNIKLYHWQTTLYSRHKATCELFASIIDLTDNFVETYIGRYTRPYFEEDFQINVSQISDDEARNLIQQYILFLKKEVPKQLKQHDTDLLNIRDELLASLNKTLYLFTLN
jgi:hypothetical protein